LTEADLRVLQELQKMTGLKNSQITRAALRGMLRRLKAQEKA